MFILAILLQIGDGYFTYWGVSNYGIQIEGNPFVAMLIEQFGLLQGLLMAKLGGVACVGFLVKTYLLVPTSRVVPGGLIIINSIYSFVVFVWYLVWSNPENFGLF
jgi:uncharacterized membrane protein (UPF0136 family)